MSSVIQLLKSYTNGAADGTGIVKLVDITKNALHLQSDSQIPDYLVTYVYQLQQSQFGSYPDSKDVAPSGVFTAVFVILMFAHLYIFTRNITRGHKFFLSLGFAFYCALRFIGFALRISWAKNILRLHVGIASEVLLILPTVFLASFNLVLAQRLFTWKHPVGGNLKIFWYIMLAIYVIVAAVVIMTIVAGVVPYLYFLSQSHYDMCRNVVKATSLMVTAYSLLAMILVLVAYVIPPSTRDKECLVYQPFWIESFAPTYFVRKNEAKEAENLFASRHGDMTATARRTILRGDIKTESNIESELEAFESSGTARFEVKHNTSILIIAFTTVCVFLGAIFRCVAMFLNKTNATQGWIFKPVVMYVLWAVLETFVNVAYLLGRVDLRFYRPDAFSKSITTKSTLRSDATNNTAEDKRDFHSALSSTN